MVAWQADWEGVRIVRAGCRAGFIRGPLGGPLGLAVTPLAAGDDTAVTRHVWWWEAYRAFRFSGEACVWRIPAARAWAGPVEGMIAPDDQCRNHVFQHAVAQPSALPFSAVSGIVYLARLDACEHSAEQRNGWDDRGQRTGADGGR